MIWWYYIFRAWKITRKENVSVHVYIIWCSCKTIKYLFEYFYCDTRIYLMYVLKSIYIHRHQNKIYIGISFNDLFFLVVVNKYHVSHCSEQFVLMKSEIAPSKVWISRHCDYVILDTSASLISFKFFLRSNASTKTAAVTATMIKHLDGVVCVFNSFEWHTHKPTIRLTL